MTIPAPLTTRKLIVLFIMVAALISCTKPTYSPVDVSSWGVLQLGANANPTNDFELAIATNDTRLVAYKHNIGGPLPGYITPVADVGATKRYGVKVIAGTPNAFPPAVASEYAAAYNQLLLQHLKTAQSK